MKNHDGLEKLWCEEYIPVANVVKLGDKKLLAYYEEQ